MRKLNLVKFAMLGMCLSMLYTGRALAAENDGTVKMDAAVSTEASAGSSQESQSVKEMMQKQLEIDKILFEEKTQELADKGITVTYTSPLETAVEVAIIPFNPENESYVYELLGKDNVSVVEGVQPELIYASGVAAEDGKMYKGEGAGETADVPEEDGIMTIQGEVVEDALDDTAVEDTDGKAVMETTAATTDASKAAESGVAAAVPVSAEIDIQAGRSPIVIASVIAVILVLSGAVYLVQRKKQVK